MTSSEIVPLTLATIASDIQIKICTFLHPSDILSLRKTCKAFLTITKQRSIWINAICRLCIDNTLFLPSFPVHDMSVMEIERATMAPLRWLRRCAAWAKEPRNKFRPKLLSPITTRIIRGPLDGIRRSMAGVQTFLVPGGRYLVANSPHGMSVWDLGYISNADCKLVASVGWDDIYGCLVNATSDGMGLIIVAICGGKHCSVYEIYPLESEAPQLTRIAQNSHLECPYPTNPLVLLMPNKVVYCILCGERILFRVWDYRLNHATNFWADFDVQKFDYQFKAIATETMIIVLHEEAIFIWEIPPLSPQSADSFDHDTTPISLLKRVPFPDDTIRKYGFAGWATMSSWYSGSSPSSLYFDALCYGSRLYGFEIVIERDFSDVSLHVINSIQLSSSDYGNILSKAAGNRICENSLVSITHSAIYFRSISPCPTVSEYVPNVINVILSVASARQPSLCSTSGRFVYPDITDQKIVVLDFL